MPEYQGIESVELIVLVDAVKRLFETFERVDEHEWRNILHQAGSDLAIARPPLTLTAEVFDF